MSKEERQEEGEEELEGGRNRMVERGIMLVLGFLWILDGVLQLQPAMFTQELSTSVLAANLVGQPIAMTKIINFGIQSFSVNPFLANLGSALVQIFIGLLLVLPFNRRIIKVFGLHLSIVWALVVWILGEGAGNMFTGNASFYTGAPGSVLLYLILAVFLLYPAKFTLRRLPSVAGGLLLVGAALQLFPIFWSEAGVQSMFALTSSDPNGLVASPAQSIAALASNAPFVSNAIMISLLGGFGMLLLVRPSRVIALSAAIFLTAVWWIMQDFGGLLTFPNAMATDPNSGPLFLLYLVPLLIGSTLGTLYLRHVLVRTRIRFRASR
jgi:hypothetical protein